MNFYVINSYVFYGNKGRPKRFLWNANMAIALRFTILFICPFSHSLSKVSSHESLAQAIRGPPLDNLSPPNGCPPLKWYVGKFYSNLSWHNRCVLHIKPHFLGHLNVDSPFKSN